MKLKGEIKKVICPYCQREMFKKKADLSNSFSEGNAFISKSEVVEFQSVWRCPKCVYSFNNSWFNNFTQFERFILREGEDEEEWAKNRRLPEVKQIEKEILVEK